jgi:hypothetical protein
MKLEIFKATPLSDCMHTFILHMVSKQHFNLLWVFCPPPSLFASGRYDTKVINSAPLFFSILCRAARVVEEPAEETTTSGK